MDLLKLRRWRLEHRYLVGNTPWDSGVSPPELVTYLDSHPPGSAIDLGCGTGTNVISMATYGWDVTGIDISRMAILLARRKIKSTGVQAKLVRGDVVRAQVPDTSFDLALDIGCFHSLPPVQRPDYVQSVFSMLKPGSDYLLYTFISPEEGEGDWPRLQEVEALFQGPFILEKVERGHFAGRASAWHWLKKSG